MPMSKKLAAEFIGTFWLVLGGCGSAVLAAAFPEVGIGLAGVSLAFGLTVLTMAYAVGHISGGHFNPAVTVGLLAAGRFKGGDEHSIAFDDRDAPFYAEFGAQRFEGALAGVRIDAAAIADDLDVAARELG